MRRNRIFSLAGIVLLTLAGCASEEAPPQTTAPAPSPSAASPAPTAAPNAVQSPTTQPLVAQRSPGSPIPGLIPSTNPRERGNQVNAEIKTGSPSDPFSSLPPQLPNPTTTRPVPGVSQLPAGTNPAGTNPGGNSPTRQPVVAANPTIPKIQNAPLGVEFPRPLPPVGSSPGEGTTSSGVGTSPSPRTRSTPTVAKPALPPPPSTDTARAVEVTGVVVVGQNPQAIVVAPGDATSRYVSAGQRISGGKVLVKRIEFPNGSEPVVILEENGVEVAKAVGERPPQAADKPAA